MPEILEGDAELYAKANSLIEDIFKFKKDKCGDLSLLETIIEYSHKFNIPIQEIGNTIADHKDYVNIFKKQLTKEGYFRDDIASTNNDEDDFDDEEW